MSRVTHRLGRRRGLFPFIVLVVAGGMATSALLLTRTEGTAAAPGLDRISNQGTPLTGVLPRDARGLARVQRDLSDIRSLRTQAGRAFYSLSGGCYGVGPAAPTNYTLGQITCVSDFPSAKRPVMDFTVFHAPLGDGRPSAERVWRSEGIAADGVASVALLSADGTVLADASVIDNTFAFNRLPSVRPAALAAYGPTGEELFSQRFGG